MKTALGALLRSGMAANKVNWLVRLLRKVLEYNVFWWKDSLLQQQFGTAIGTSCAPPYSGLFMEELTDSAFQEWLESHPAPDHNIQDWCRLIDDGFGLWTGPLSILRELLTFLSSRVPSMKFTMEQTCPRENCPEAEEEGHECQLFLTYLDLKMFVDGEGKIQTDMYRKPNRKCQYLSPDSEHPRHVFANIPKSLVYSVVRNVSVPGMRKERLEELRQLLLSRGYRAGALRKVIDYGMGLDRDASLEKVQREDQKNGGRVRYTITYDSKLPHLPQILSKNWRVMVQTDQRLKKAFPAPPMACLKRGPNLQDKLVRARLPPRLGRPGSSRLADGQRPGFRCCKAGRRSCSMCPYTGPASDSRTVVTEVTIKHSGKVIPIYHLQGHLLPVPSELPAPWMYAAVLGVHYQAPLPEIC